MIRFTRPVVLAAIVAIIGVLPSTAGAATPWRVLGEHNGSNTDVSSSIRDADGVLHVIYTDKIDTGNFGIRHRTISRAGVVSAADTVVSGWVGVTNADIEIVAGVPHVFWGGQRSTDVADPASSGKAWYATLTGGAWSAPQQFTTNNQPYATTSFSTGIDATGAPWGAWWGTGIMFTHAGLAPGGAEVNHVAGLACCDYAGNLGRDRVTGELFLNYFSNASGRVGFYTKRVAPSEGTATLLAGGADDGQATGASTRMSAAERTVGGVFSAHCDSYPTCNGIRVASATSEGLRYGLSDANRPTISDGVWTAPGPDGRMWLMWANRSRTYVVRSNKAFTKWGALQSIANPPRTDTNWRLNGEGSLGFLDLFGNVTTTTGGNLTRPWTMRVKPALSITPPLAIAVNNVPRLVRFRVTDAGDRVVGAKVRFRGVVRTTNALGYASFVLPAGTRTGRYPALGFANGYVSATGAILVRQPRG